MPCMCNNTPPPNWFGAPQPVNTPGTLKEQLQQATEGLEFFAKWKKELEDSNKKKDEPKKGKFAEGLSKGEIFLFMTLVSPIIGWGMANLYAHAIHSIGQAFR